MDLQKIDVDKHREIIVSFRRDSFRVSFGTNRDFDEKEYVRWVEKQSDLFPDGFILLMEEGVPIGQLELTVKDYEDSKIGYVNLYYLIPERRGSGMGNKLHQYSLQFFRTHGVSEYHLRVSPSNHQALGFYRRIGMRECKKEFGGTVIRMRGTVSE
ncbi:GNAT family N-acetyltransferase [Rossellomorea marisflavi]|uniref:GNAT family N-acetyltransferase n=1 Tax=Rossellomorea marisflavi TaxID=189381 RepID=UPI00064F743C|nr:GNAT family N-acetyltransferase [Rossellomorea marisflavi]KMK95216.1 GCN5 family acetyltransferase [Rossellomorea marisflavi]KML08320.1 GCN5 family acetyltransferase [Rossellomorea marisflavi]TYO68834.1 GNAT family N-acetyltransferase [Rossellomorea marisflavi]